MTCDALIEFCNPLTVKGPKPDRPGLLCDNSSSVRPGDIFIAIRGLKTDGHRYIGDAIERGARIIIGEEIPTSVPNASQPELDDVCFIQVTDTQMLLGPLAQALAGNPQKELTIIGVTGTNGKTTVTTLIWQILQKSGVRSALLGTIARYIDTERLESRLTTAGPIELARDMQLMLEKGCTHLAMEVSSHALDQYRTAGIDITIAVFTNLTRDHLDYHGDMATYASVKERLFRDLGESSRAVINLDDPYGSSMADACKGDVLGFSFDQFDDSIPCRMIDSGEDGMTLTVNNTRIRTPLIGSYNAYNVVEAFLVCSALGIDPSDTVEAFKSATGAPGRLEKVTRSDEKGKKPTVVVDYAHTPDALKKVTATLKRLRRDGQKLIVIFGCGGDRDREKRPMMAQIAESLADQIVVTSDNPRSEDPDAIIREISAGFNDESKWSAVTLREEAITNTILSAPANSIILIAGKGHETYQVIKGERTHFDDREVARRALDKRNNTEKAMEVH